MTTALIVGSQGALGKELQKFFNEQAIDYVALNSKELDITNREIVIKKVQQIMPDIIFNAAAYTNVDKAEKEDQKINYKVNGEGPANLAQAAQLVDAVLVHVSTDYVFDGNNETEYSESDKTNPMQEYGKAKLAGEDAVLNSGAKAYIVRTSWVFGEFGHNFIQTMQKLALTHSEVSVISDKYGRPTWTRTLAEFMWYLVTNNCEYGIYNLSNDGKASWYEFASELLKDQDVKVLPVLSESFSQVAYRPTNSVLNLEKAKKTGFKILTWQAALQIYLKGLNKIG